MIEPRRSRFQFTLRTLLLLFVVAASSLGVFGAWGLLVFVVSLGVAIRLRETAYLWSPLHRMLLFLCALAIIGWLLVPDINGRDGPRSRHRCANHLIQVSTALLKYHDTYGHFPPAYIADRNSKPTHSWRTLLLPLMERDSLYKNLDLTQSWDAVKNKGTLMTALRFYNCPDDPAARASGATQTSYLAVVGSNAASTGEQPRKLTDFGDDASDTIMLIEVIKSGIHWAEPRDLSLDSFGAVGSGSPTAVAVHHCGHPDGFFFSYDHGSGVNVAMADGNVCFLRTDNLSTEELRSVLHIGGCREGTVGYRALIDDDTGKRLNWPNIAALAVWLISVATLLTAAVRGRKAPSVHALVAAPSCQNPES
jgi:prepilin-type processing-associated H-X9-DG protein